MANTEIKVNTGVINEYVNNPKSITNYKLRRGVTDFSQIGMYDQYETGYSFLSVIKMPQFIEESKQKGNEELDAIIDSFRLMLEYEFRGLSGLPDITGETLQITDGGSNEIQMISNVQRDTSVTVSMTYYERRGSLIAKFANYYLTGIKDPISKAKTYHGLIKNGTINDPGYDKEVFTFLYYVTDNTMLRLEKAYLLCNCQLTKAEESMYDSDKGSISNRETTLEFNCYPITGYEVDKAAYTMLKSITGVEYTNNKFEQVDLPIDRTLTADSLDTSAYKFGILEKSTNPTDQDTGHYSETGKNFNELNANL